MIHKLIVLLFSENIPFTSNVHYNYNYTFTTCSNSPFLKVVSCTEESQNKITGRTVGEWGRGERKRCFNF
jgi:hypothetical protein